MATPTTLPATFTAGQVLTAAQQNALRGAFRILQVVSTTKTDTFTTTSATMTDITGLSVSITPSSTTSKILVFFEVYGQGTTGATQGYLQLVRNSTAIAIGDAAGDRPRVSGVLFATDAFLTVCSSLVFLDSPATTAATTYKVQTNRGGSGTVYINRTENDADNTARQRTVSSITVMEVSA